MMLTIFKVNNNVIIYHGTNWKNKFKINCTKCSPDKYKIVVLNQCTEKSPKFSLYYHKIDSNYYFIVIPFYSSP